MSDQDAITSLLYRYAELIDAGDFEGVANLLADAELSFEGFGDIRRGRTEVLALYASTTRRYLNGTPLTKHVTTNAIVEIGDGARTATARSYFTVLQAVPGELALQPIIAGRYHDSFACIDGAWRFARRHMLIDLVGELGHHMMVDIHPKH